MNRDVCEHFNPVDLPCEKCSVQKSTLHEAAQQALEAMEKATRFMSDKDYRKLNESIDVLKAALAGQTVPSDCTDSHQPLTIERLRDALVASRIIQPAAVEDPDEYDDGVTLFRIEALHRRIT